MKTLFCLLAYLCPLLSNAATENEPIQIGGAIPSVQIRAVINAPFTSINLNDYKGKTLLIHFLLTTCPSCIASSKKYDSLLKASGDGFKVLIVSIEKKEKLQQFLKLHPGYFGSVPVVAADTVLKRLFPYEYVSHIVWINPQGRLAAVTGNQYVTVENIKQVATGSLPAWPVKRDLVAFDTKAPLMKLNDDNIPYSSLPASVSYSAFYSSMPDIPVGSFQSVDSINQLRRVTYTRHSITELYMRILGQSFPKAFVLINAPDRAYYFYDKERYYRQGWEEQNTYSYEAVLPITMGAAAVQRKMLADIDLYLGTQGVIKDTVLSCRVLVKQGTASLPLKDSLIPDGKWMAVRNISYNLNESYSAMPSIDQVPDLDEKFIPVSVALLKDPAALQKQLNVYGLALVEKPMRIKALVISQPDPFRFSHSHKMYSK